MWQIGRPPTGVKENAANLLLHACSVLGMQRAQKQLAPSVKVLRDLHLTAMSPVHHPAVRVLLGQLGYLVSPGEFESRLQAFEGHTDHRLIIAERKSEVIGFMHAYFKPCLHKPASVVVQAIVVSENARGTGVGKLFLNEASRWAEEIGCDEVSLYSNVSREDAFKIYRALGYEHRGTSHALALRLR